PYDFVELAKDVCKRNESIARYIGDNFSVDKNKKLRRLRDRFREGTDNRILILRLKPLVLAWRSSYSGGGTNDRQKEEFNREILHSTDLSALSDPQKNEIPENIKQKTSEDSGKDVSCSEVNNHLDSEVESYVAQDYIHQNYGR